MLQRYNFEPKNEGLNLLYSVNTLVFGLPLGIIVGLSILFGYDLSSTTIILPAVIIVLVGGISYFYYFGKIKGVSELSVSDQKLNIRANNKLLDIPFVEAKIYLLTSIYVRFNEIFFIKYKNNFYFFRVNKDLKNFLQSKKYFKNYKILQLTGEIILVILAVILIISIF